MVTLNEMQAAIEEGACELLDEGCGCGYDGTHNPSCDLATRDVPVLRSSISVRIDFFPFASLDSVPTAYNFARRLSRAANKSATNWCSPFEPLRAPPALFATRSNRD